MDPQQCIDPSSSRPRSPLEVAEGAIRGGACAIQLRVKSGKDRNHLKLAEEMAALCRTHEVPFIVNDRLDIALAAGADELHLGQDDLPVAYARRLAPHLPVGKSTHNERELLEATREDVQRIAFGPVFPTSSKAHAEPAVGVDGLREAIEKAGRPLIAIGGINQNNAALLRGLNLEAVAVISAVCAAPNPEDSVRQLHQLLNK
ncbi:MAG: thiamine phosphate synthase [Sandaracinaceae bacterium]|nr:thiamine phosphate synthase [Sandaracinaceae bacterium]